MDACLSWKSCYSEVSCNDMGIAGGPGPCDKTTIKGACCSLQCDATVADPEGIARYRALDACIHCKTCASLCATSTDYCPVFAPGGNSVCPP
jgi:hypothetical protein